MYKGKNAAYKFIEAIFAEYDYCKGIMENFLTKMLLCLQKKKDFNWVIVAVFVISYLMLEIKKVRDQSKIQRRSLF